MDDCSLLLMKLVSETKENSVLCRRNLLANQFMKMLRVMIVVLCLCFCFCGLLLVCFAAQPSRQGRRMDKHSLI